MYCSLPAIDEHNRQRQNILDVEGAFPTQDCYFKLAAAITGQCVVDFLRVAAFKFPERYSETRLTNFADMMSGGISKEFGKRSQTTAVSNRRQLVGIRKHGGGPALKKARKNSSSQLPYQKSCFMCRKYYTKYMMTSAACPDCGTALCRVDRTVEDQDRTMSCYQEHMSHTDDRIRCRGSWGHRQTHFPADLMSSNKKGWPKGQIDSLHLSIAFAAYRARPLNTIRAEI